MLFKGSYSMCTTSLFLAEIKLHICRPPAAALGDTNKVVYSAVRPHDQKSDDKQVSDTSAHVSFGGFFNIVIAPSAS